MSRRRTMTCASIAVLVAVGAVVVWKRDAARERLDEASVRALFAAIPPSTDAPSRGYAGSESCKECHDAEHASWFASHHRRMTTPALPENVIGDFSGRSVTFYGRTYRFERKDGEFFVEMPDPVFDWERRGGVRDPSRDAADPPPTTRKRIVMTTGSHHQQVYWVEGKLSNQLDYVPIVWLVAEKEWRPLRDVFLWHPGREEHLRFWNDSCIHCHSTDGIPKPIETERGWARATSAAELGIACEACHGPAAAHVASRQAEKAGAAAPIATRPARGDPTIANPARMPERRSSEVCGLCHAVTHSIDQEGWYHRGFRYRPGDELEKTEIVLRPGEPAHAAYFEERSRHHPNFVADSWWPDGHVRVSGREYSDLIGSPCFVNGPMECTSCHSMHDYHSAADQMKRNRVGDAQCTQCHDADRYGAEAHVIHRADSPGARCVECHAPQTSYGLLKAIRSHRVSSPSVATTLATGRPNACNLCHLDRSLAWTQDVLEKRYGAKPVEIPEERRTIAAGVHDLVAGDASVRAIAAWHVAKPEVRRASGDDWQAPLVAALLEDDYSAVRFFARRTLATLPERDAAGRVDDLAPAEARARARAAIEAAFERTQAARGAARRADASLLLKPDGTFDRAAYERLKERRDDRPMDLAE